MNKRVVVLVTVRGHRPSSSVFSKQFLILVGPGSCQDWNASDRFAHAVSKA